MPKYRVAHVQFSDDGRPYPVNSKYLVEPGDFVIVRLEGKFTPLQKARVVSVDFWKGECKHSIVCLADKAEAYGGGPDAIANESDLEKFLTGFLKMKKCPVVYRKNSFLDKAKKHPRWRVAYIQTRDLRWGTNGFVKASKLLIMGDEEITHAAPDNGNLISMLDGSLLLMGDSYIGHRIAAENVDNCFLARDTLEPVKYGNIFRLAAILAERPLAVDLAPTDDSYAVIKSIIGDASL